MAATFPLCWTCVQGSGKTLAFAIPILQALMHERAKALREAAAAAAGDGPVLWDPSDSSNAEAMIQMTAPAAGPLRALILCPTRELAMQVRCPANSHFQL